MNDDFNQARDSAPTTPKDLWIWIYAYTGIKIAREKVCNCHTSPWTAFKTVYFDRPSTSLVCGPRGGGKSFLSGLETHLTSRFNPRHSTRILGGSKAQSEQIYRALNEIAFNSSGPLGCDADTLAQLLKTEAHYHNGSDVSILAASSTSVRGPHIPSLKLDEVEEMDSDIRESSVGMCVDQFGYKASIAMSSTWHRVGGPMAELIERGQAGDFPVFSFCIFEVLERCPTERSGKFLEKCPECPLMKYCHSDSSVLPKAKLSNGHYSIDALIQKIKTVSVRTFEADYLCSGPKTDGLWFKSFHRDTHTSVDAEYNPSLPVHLAIDSGVFTGAVFFQIDNDEITVFADYLSEGQTAQENALALVQMSEQYCNSRRDSISTDPAGGSRTAIGPTVIGEYIRAGLCSERSLQKWPYGSVSDSLALLEGFVEPAGGGTHLKIHPRCVNLINAFEGYSRAKRAGQFQDYPSDPQHPFEDLIDALRGGVKTAYPDGRTPKPSYKRVSPRSIF